MSNYSGEAIDILKTQKALGVVPEILLREFLDLIFLANKEKLVDFIDKIWEDGVVIENFLKDFAYYLKEQFRKSKDIKVNFLLDTISSIYFTLNEFKYEEDKRLLGYVLIHELYKNNRVKVLEKKLENFENLDVDDEKNSYGNSKIFDSEEANETKKSFEKKEKVDDISKEKEEIVEEELESEENINISIFRKKIRRIMSELKNLNTAFSIYFQNANFLKVEKNMLYVEVENDFIKNKIMGEDKKEIEEAINKICKTNIEVKAVVLKNKVKSESQKFLDKMTDFFEGEILKRKNKE